MTDATTTGSAEGFADLVDEVTPEILRELTELKDPCVSLLLPTDRANRNLRHDALQLRSLAEQAAAQLRERGVDPDAILEPVTKMVGDTPFWALQGEGLAVYADVDGHHVFRLPRRVEPVAQVGAAPRLVPLVPVATGDESFHIVALSQNAVRLFAASRDGIQQIDLGSVPASLEDMERTGTREPELQHQHQLSSRGVATFHGHGGTDSSDIAVANFVAEVAAGLRARLGANSTEPLVLAAVAEYLPALQATGQLPTLLDVAVTGNPESLRADELLGRAWPIVKSRLARRREELAERFRAAHGTGTAVSDPVELRRAADEGRVDMILVPPSGSGPSAGGRPDESDDVAVAAALRTGAQVGVADLPEGIPLAAILRY